MTPLRSLKAALAVSALLAGLAPIHALAETKRMVVISGGEKVGHLEAERHGDRISIHYDVKNNGRGPTISEALTLDENGLPVKWTIDGSATFGGDVHESFERSGNNAHWRGSTGSGRATMTGPGLYIAQNASPWDMGVYARALLKDEDHSIPTLPEGTMSLEALDPVTLTDAPGAPTYRPYLLKDVNLTPDMILLDKNDDLVAKITPKGVIVREAQKDEADKLSALATRLTSERFERMQQRFAHNYDTPVRIRNVRIFDPKTKTVGKPVSVVFFRNRITGIQPLDAPATPGEVTVDGDGRTLLPGLHDMHAHMSLQSALLYIASGVTSVRDMGNDNQFLLNLTQRINAGKLIGPRIVRNGFTEGRSPYSARNGIIVDSQQAALDAVRWYAARGYWQIKVYNSMNPDWVPALAKLAHDLGMHVTGHIPAFTNADKMIAAGYDEVTHVNQLMLGWVLKPDEDTRTPLRLTAMRRTAGLDLDSPRVQETLDTMEAQGISHGPTAVTLELLMLGRDGVPNPAMAEYFDHLPIGLQRHRKKAIAPINGSEDDKAYKSGFETVKKLLKRMHDRGIRLLPGTDSQNGLSLHRELEIYTEAGIPAPEVLRMDTLALDQYMGRDEDLGSIERGKYADFILVDGNPAAHIADIHKIAMTVKNGTVYFPSDLWKAVGVKPFAPPPKITEPEEKPGKAPMTGAAHDPADEFLF